MKPTAPTAPVPAESSLDRIGAFFGQFDRLEWWSERTKIVPKRLSMIRTAASLPSDVEVVALARAGGVGPERVFEAISSKVAERLAAQALRVRESKNEVRRRKRRAKKA